MAQTPTHTHGHRPQPSSANGPCARRSQCTAYGRCSAFSGELFKPQPNTHPRPFHHACIVPSPVAAALHSAARQVAVEVSSTPTTHTPAAPIVAPPLSPPRSLSPSVRLPRHDDGIMDFLSSLLSRRGRPCPSDPAPFRTLSPFAPVKSLRQNRRIAQAGVRFKRPVVAYGVTSRIGAVHRGSSWSWP